MRSIKTLAVFDRKNYSETSPRTIRNAARAIIRKNNLFALLLQQTSEMYLFPGGGVEEGESGSDALIREIREETGLVVKPHTIVEFGLVIEIKRDLYSEDGIYEMHDYYYTCDVEDVVFERKLTEREQEKGYKLVFVSCDEAISGNMEFMRRNNVSWSETETYILKQLMRH